jgi:hypothetical protein
VNPTDVLNAERKPAKSIPFKGPNNSPASGAYPVTSRSRSATRSCCQIINSDSSQPLRLALSFTGRGNLPSAISCSICVRLSPQNCGNSANRTIRCNCCMRMHPRFPAPFGALWRTHTVGQCVFCRRHHYAQRRVVFCGTIPRNCAAKRNASSSAPRSTPARRVSNPLYDCFGGELRPR